MNELGRLTVRGLLAALLLALNQAPAWAQASQSLAAPAPAAVRIGAEDDWYPYSGARQGKAVGMVPDMVLAAYGAVGVRVELVSLPYARCMKLAATSHLLGCFDTLRNPMLEHQYRWARQPLLRARINIYAPAGVPQGRDAGREVQLADLRGKQEAVTNGYEYGQAFDSDTAMRRDVGSSDLFALQKLARGRVDYALVYDRVVDSLLAEHPELRGRVKAVGTLIEPDIYISFAPAYPEVARYIALFDEGLAHIKQSGEYARIASRWGAMARRTGERLAIHAEAGADMQHVDEQEIAWAIVGPGRIAHQFAGAVAALPATHVRSVYGRNPANAQAFAERWPHGGQPARVAASLDELLADPGVHGVYVATPHAQHGQAVRAALLAGKAVLCEKPLVAHLAEGEELVALARERGVFLMEALWTRFLPAYQVAGRWLREGVNGGVNGGLIGPVRAIQSSFCFNAPYDPAHRNFNPALAGGALLDLGVYNLAITRWALESAPGHCPEPAHLQAHAVLAPTGVDQRLAATLVFDGGVTSQFVCGFDGNSDNAMHILGERGSIVFRRGFSYATEVVLTQAGQAPQVVAAPFRVNGFEYEVEEALRCMRAGLLECPNMPHAESLALLRWMDALRRQVGVRYPFE